MANNQDLYLLQIGDSSTSYAQQIAAIQKLCEKSGVKYSMHSTGTTLGTYTKFFSWYSQYFNVWQLYLFDRGTLGSSPTSHRLCSLFGPSTRNWKNTVWCQGFNKVNINPLRIHIINGQTTDLFNRTDKPQSIESEIASVNKVLATWCSYKRKTWTRIKIAFKSALWIT